MFPFGYFRASRRGQNGFLKIRYGSIKEFNSLADRLEQILQRHFLSLGILCDFETKGTITDDKSGGLAKFPFTTQQYPCRMRDETDNWTSQQLEKFNACPVVNARRIECIMGQIETDEDKAIAFAQHKMKLEEEQKAKDQKLAPSPPLMPNPVVTIQSKPSVRLSTARLKTELPPSESADAFRRNLEDLRPFTRAFYSAHRRFPTTNEALEWLKTNNRYSGEWEDREGRRGKRVEQILRFTEQGFDPEMLSKGGKPSVSLDRGRFAWWVEQRFGSMMTARIRDISRSEIMTTGKDGPFDAVTVKAPTTIVSIPAKFRRNLLVCCPVLSFNRPTVQ